MEDAAVLAEGRRKHIEPELDIEQIQSSTNQRISIYYRRVKKNL